MSSILKVENLSYKDILKNISFEIETKSFTVLVGPNGCGKTTLIKCLIGIQNYNGNIFFDNCLLQKKQNDKSINKEIGFVISSRYLMHDTVMSNLMDILLNLRYSEKAAKKKIYSILDNLGVGYLSIKKISELTNSERIVLNFLMCVIADPKVIIIDDIFDGMSDSYKKKIFNYIKKLKDKTILFMTSNEENIFYADNVIILNKGTIIKQNVLDDIIKDEKSFTKNGLKLPLSLDLSHKLKAYDLIKDITVEIDKMVNEVWE